MTVNGCNGVTTMTMNGCNGVTTMTMNGCNSVNYDNGHYKKQSSNGRSVEKKLIIVMHLVP